MHLFELDQEINEGIRDPHIFKAIFTAGPPGAGKNTIIQELGLNATGLKMQDIDHTLAYLRRMHPEKANYGASLDTTLKRQGVFEKSMLGLLINTTGRDSEHLMELNRKLKESGYDTFMLFVDVDYDVAFHRIHNREQHATDPKDKRKVDLPYFHQAFEAAKENLDFYALMFGNQFALVSNNVRIVEDENDAKEFARTLDMAAKKIHRFLKKPLTAKAQAIVDQLSKKAT